VQLGKAAGARVIGTAGGPEKCAVARDLGADEVIDYNSEDLVARAKELTGGRGADVIFDPVGGDVFDASRRIAAFEGRILVIGFVSGRFADAPTNHILVKNYEVVGVHWGFYKQKDPSRIAQWQGELNALWADRRIDPLVGVELPLDQAPEALRRLGSRGTTGKVVLVP
jgi:NADPH:quinone reductase